MEKEALISALKEKAGVDNLSERTYDEVATMFLPQFADDEKITEETWKFPLQMVKSMSGQLRHDLSGGISAFKTQFETDNKAAQEKAIADAIAAAKAEWEKANGGGNSNQQNQQNNQPDIDQKIADAMAKAISGLTGEEGAIGKLSKQLSDYLTQQAEKEKAATEEQMRSELRELVMSFDGLDEDDVVVENTMLKLNISKDREMSAMKAEAKSIYEKVYKKFVEKHGGGQPFTGGGSSSQNSNTEFQNYIKAKQAEAAQEAKDAEALKKDMM